MVAYLNKSDASEGFNQIIDFLNGSYVAYALTINPTIYVSCIKQFWNTVVVKQSNDATRIQALVDKKKVVVTEATIRDALHLDDAEGVDCLPNEEIFATLARMGYEKPSTKLTFYKAFFSSQWKFLIHTILQSMSAKRTSWNEFSSAMASAVICLATARIEAIRLFLAYASFMGFMVYQMDVKSAFLYGTTEEEVYVCQPLVFEDPDYPDKVYKVVKALYGLHQAPRACKSDASEGFDQIINFINESYIAYALIVNPTIYVSCIIQFWRTVVVKSSNDVTRLQALVEKKKVVVTEATIRDALHLDDAEGVDCLPNEETFATLARMDYEKPSTKLTFYKAFFSSQWKFLIYMILQSMSAKRTSWNEFSSAMASAVICLAIGCTFNFLKYIFESLVRNVDSSSKFYMYPRFIILIIHNQLGDLSTHSTKYTSPALTQKVFANMRRVGKGCSGVETPLFEGMIVAREPQNQGHAVEQGDEEE
nr:putative ribonuclease H-like domain-containing protein [Tanacetum cinerariifolium]